jgi:hypothetical protein
MAITITIEVTVIASGDQNPPLVVTGIVVGPKTPGAPVDDPVDVPVDPPMGVVDDGVADAWDAWVTSNVAVETSPEVPVAVIVYVPRDTTGTVNSILCSFSPYGISIDPMFVESRVMLTG